MIQIKDEDQAPLKSPKPTYPQYTIRPKERYIGENNKRASVKNYQRHIETHMKMRVKRMQKHTNDTHAL